MITKEQLAEKLNNRQYRNEITKEEIQEAKESNLVVIFGASDDLIELRGAIYEELDMYNGGIIYFDKDGLLKNECEDGCPYFKKVQDKAKQVLAAWDYDGYSWSISADYTLNAAYFDILDDDGSKYCKGCIFSMKDLL